MRLGLLCVGVCLSSEMSSFIARRKSSRGLRPSSIVGVVKIVEVGLGLGLGLG